MFRSKKVKLPIEYLSMSPEKVWNKNEWQRVDMTVSCRDTDYINKRKNAGNYKEINGQKFQIMHNGLYVKAGGYHGEWMQKIIEKLKGHHEPQEEKLFYEILKYLDKSPVILELGSFWSYYSLWLLKEFPNAKSFCCEPDPVNMKVGKANATVNGLSGRIKFINAAAGETDKEIIDFNLDSDPSKKIKAKVRTVDSLAEEFKIKKIDILHMDVQGVELSALQGSLKMIKDKKVRFVFVSTHHYLFSGDPLTHQRCKDFLVDNGAHIISAHNVLESFSGDGLIVASFDKRDADLIIETSKNDSDNSLFRAYEYDLSELSNYYGNQSKKRK